MSSKDEKAPKPKPPKSEDPLDLPELEDEDPDQDDEDYDTPLYSEFERIMYRADKLVDSGKVTEDTLIKSLSACLDTLEQKASKPAPDIPQPPPLVRQNATVQGSIRAAFTSGRSVAPTPAPTPTPMDTDK